jgi:hypothetical protein
VSDQDRLVEGEFFQRVTNNKCLNFNGRAQGILSLAVAVARTIESNYVI